MLRKAGARVEEAPLAPSFEGIHAAGDMTVRAEAAAFHRELYAKNAADYPKHIGEAVKAGLGIGAVDYLAAQALRRRFRSEMGAIAARYDGLGSPTTTRPPPQGLEDTGDSHLYQPFRPGGMASHSRTYGRLH